MGVQVAAQMAFVDISDKLSATGALGIKSTPLESGSADRGVLSGHALTHG